MNISKHTIHKAIYDLCLEIENLPSSEQQTKCVVMASNLHGSADQLLDALRDMLTTYRDDTEMVLVTEERMEAWRRAAELPNDGTQRGRDAEATNATETRTRPSLK